MKTNPDFPSLPIDIIMNRLTCDLIGQFRVLSYNILADRAAQTGGFVGKSVAELEWDVRLPILVEQITRAEPDLFALQECNKIGDFIEAFPDYDFTFASKGKSSRFGDGVALLWRRHTFTLRRNVFEQEHDDNHSVSLAVVLQHNSTQLDFMVATTHLKAKPGRVNVAMRGTQIGRLIPRIDTSLPTILMGDLNAVDDGSEPLFSYLKEARFQEPFTMKWSTYKERKFTSFDAGGVVLRTIDHLLLRGTLRCASFIKAPPHCETLPNKHNPSDHLPLIADLIVWK